ncbi:MAG: hypothetical protein BGO70_01145 [Bacteroidetes bacterium 43-93]|uniref:hypothetical protein n=1 Tax=uncultured Dysgonomonas sp. TaxID=206096 RepID=UPI0009299E02|nr:hypothetical protein [uncultured Dysgonomonas sp.]MBN9483117.1 hypothetical protein [Bacteroidota bacterium]OJW96318.1 MAG: hypothetical protein BGO70_01145 [Bacteroidetes bacterium 43-93]
MEKRYLLYIDILGFSELVKTDYSKIEKLYSTIDKLNSHDHPNFKTLVFSDTILIFNCTAPTSQHDHEYLVMYLCEFAQNLLFKCCYLDIQFRAILTYDIFQYEKLTNIEAYFGNALVKAYRKEKDIVGLGLFIDKSIATHNKIFETTEFDIDLDFVFLLPAIKNLKMYGCLEFPLDKYFPDPELEFFGLKLEFKILQNFKDNIELQKDSKVRSKYIQTYYLYKTAYKELIDILERNYFDIQFVSSSADWDNTDLIE